jgi:adenylyltransferase/sulfurtransferase
MSGPVLPPLVAPGPPLTPDERARYARHLLLPEIGEVGQRRLRAARVCVVGAGGLGAPVLQYLAAAGVGRIGIVDDDVVDVTNLQRQVIHGHADVGRPKAESAAETVRAIDPGVEVVEHRVRLAEDTVDLLAGYDVVVDGTDNFPTRYLVNDACVRLGLPEVWGSVLRFDAQVAVFWGRPPAPLPPVQLRDVFPAPPAEGTVPSCAVAGVLGALCGQVGSLMATEVVKLVTGAGRPLLGRIAVLDALAGTWREVPLRPRAHPSEAAAPAAAAPSTAPAASVAPAARPPAPAQPDAAGEVTPRDLVPLLAEGAVTLLDVREPAERAIVTIPGDQLAIPLGELPARVGEVPPDRPVVVYCRSGARSAHAAAYLAGAGYAAANLAGGVLAWADDVEPGLPRY